MFTDRLYFGTTKLCKKLEKGRTDLHETFTKGVSMAKEQTITFGGDDVGYYPDTESGLSYWSKMGGRCPHERLPGIIIIIHVGTTPSKHDTLSQCRGNVESALGQH